MTDHRTKLKTLLRELFQFDAADLDFGIYRIMNQRRDEIDEFIERGLLDTVAQEFTQLQQHVIREKQQELTGLAHQVRSLINNDALDDEGKTSLQLGRQVHASRNGRRGWLVPVAPFRRDREKFGSIHMSSLLDTSGADQITGRIGHAIPPQRR